MTHQRLQKLPWTSFIATVVAAQLSLFCASHGSSKEINAAESSTETSISQDEAARRAEQVENIHYDLTLDMTSGSTTGYSGTLIVRFDVKGAPQDIRLDFFDGTISDLKINDVAAAADYNRHFLVLPKSKLKAGANSAALQFTAHFGQVSQGLSRFQDPEDKTIYFMTEFEPFGANRAFPCFDQPDLKATFKLTVRVPEHNVVVSSTRETSVTKTPEGASLWQFPESAPMSTYVFSMQAGPYHIFESPKNSAIPMRVLVRPSLAKYVDPKEWFDTTARGLQFFQSYFQTPYPFQKYDQILVPELRSGAMENIAAVTFNERFVSRGVKSRREKRALASVILHEMAHMWFGDLVTMKWWNDLWLNESFADFASLQAMISATPYTEDIHDRLYWKSWAFIQDESTTTHPIVTDTPNTLEAFAHFDSITYAKGAAVLTQLMASLGEAQFRKGLAAYFQKYSWKNARLQDFMGAMSEASSRDLTTWQNQWLTTTGFNRVRPEWTCNNGKISQLKLIQSEGSSTLLRSHTLKMAILNKTVDKKGAISAIRTSVVLPVTLQNQETVVAEAKGLSCPYAVYPNAEELSFINVDLDEGSIHNLLPNVTAITDPILRHEIWFSLWQQVRAARLNVMEYQYWMVHEGLEKETDPLVLEQILGTAAGSGEVGGVLKYIPRATDQEKVEYQDQLSILEDVTWKRLRQAPGGSEIQRLFFDAFVQLSETKLAIDDVRALLNGQVRLNNMKLDQDQRWALIYRLSRTGQPDADALIQSELQKDRSSFGQEAAMAAHVAVPVWAEKSKMLTQIKTNPSPLTTGQRRRVLRVFFPRNQEDLRAGYQPHFFDDLKNIHERDPFLAMSFVQLAPNTCDPKSAPVVADFIKKTTLNPNVHRDLLLHLEEGLRCQKIMTLAREGGFRPPDLPQVPEQRHRRRRHRHTYSDNSDRNNKTYL